ncbi:hypothetical protein ACQPZF_24365 [Actinosynnema sp. CS-041913]
MTGQRNEARRRAVDAEPPDVGPGRRPVGGALTVSAPPAYRPEPPSARLG